jgi:hypothetical protein
MQHRKLTCNLDVVFVWSVAGRNSSKTVNLACESSYIYYQQCNKVSQLLLVNCKHCRLICCWVNSCQTTCLQRTTMFQRRNLDTSRNMNYTTLLTTCLQYLFSLTLFRFVFKCVHVLKNADAV